MPTPEETRDRILQQITDIIEHSEKEGAFQAPEVRIPTLRSALYAMMTQEFAECARFHDDFLGKAQDELKVPRTASAKTTLAALTHLVRTASRQQAAANPPQPEQRGSTSPRPSMTGQPTSKHQRTR